MHIIKLTEYHVTFFDDQKNITRLMATSPQSAISLAALQQAKPEREAIIIRRGN